MKTTLIAVGMVGALVLLARAELGDAGKLPPAANKQVDFAKDIKPLLDKSCVGCHGPEKPKSKYRVDSREAIIQGGSSDEAAIVIGNSAKSPLAHYIAELVEDMEMPPTDKRDKYPPLSKEQVGLFRAWIDQGAKWPAGVEVKAP
jgi:hypothetical protein